MKKKKVISLLLALSMLSGVTACQNGKTNKTGTAADAQETDADDGTAQEGEGDAQGSLESAAYAVTEENDNPELSMARQPEASYWFPSQLLEWDPNEDEDLLFNVSTVPLAQRVDPKNLEPVNETQNPDTKVMAVSILNSSTSGNAPHGLNRANANTFSYWQYVDTLVYWGGSSGEGLIVAPSADIVDAGHKNGVKVIGTVFMPQTAHGGKMEWLEDLLKKESDGSYPVADRLIEVAKTYGFDGWFMNQETEGTKEEPLTKGHADRMRY